MNNSTRRCSKIHWRMLLLGLHCRFLLAIEFFRIWFYWHRLLLLYLGPQQNVPSIVFLSAISLFYLSLHPLFFARFLSVFFRSSCLIRSVFSESLVIGFAMFFVAPRDNIIVLLDFGGSYCKMAWVFSLIELFPYSFISCPSQVVSSRKNSDCYSLTRSPVSWSFYRIVKKIFFGVFLFSPL